MFVEQTRPFDRRPPRQHRRGDDVVAQDQFIHTAPPVRCAHTDSSDRRALHVDLPRRRVTEARFGTRRHQGQLLFEFVRRPDIVAVEKGDKLPPAIGDADILGYRLPPVGLADDLDFIGMLFGVLLQNRQGIVL